MKDKNKTNKIVSIALATLMMSSVLTPLTEIKVNAQTENTSSITRSVNRSTEEKEAPDRPEPIRDESVEWVTSDFEITNGKIMGFSSQGYEKFNRNPVNVVVKLPDKDKDGLAVTGVGDEAFKYDKAKFKHKMQLVDIPDSITEFEVSAFEDQELWFGDFKVPHSWTKVEPRAFKNSYFKSLNLSNLNKESENIHFSGIITPYVDFNGLGDYTLNYSQNIKNEWNNGFFEYSKLKLVNFGNSKIKLNKYAFNRVNNDKNVYSSFKITWDGQTGNADYVVPKWQETIPLHAFSSCDALTSVELKDLPQLTTIDSYAFSSCNGLTSIRFENLPKLTTIGDDVFYQCKGLTSVELKDLPELKTIGSFAFYNCDALTSIRFENLPKLTTIGSYAFSSCDALTSVELKDLPQLTTIGNWVFYNCNALTSIRFENLPKLTTIGNYAFKDCKNLKEVIFKDTSIKSIGSEAFLNCSIDTLNFIENKDFSNVPLEIANNAFRNNKIINLNLPARYNKDTGSSFINQVLTRVLEDENFKDDPNYKFVDNSNEKYVIITNPISIKHGDSSEYLGSIETNPYVELLDGPKGESKMLMKIKGNTALGDTFNATWSNNKLKISDVGGSEGFIPFTGSVNFTIAFKDLGEVHLMKDNWKHKEPIEPLEILRTSPFPSDKIIAKVVTSEDSTIKDANIDRKIIFKTVDTFKPAGTKDNAVVRVYFKDGTYTDVEIPTVIIKTEQDQLKDDIQSGKIKPTKEIVKQYADYDLSDNFGKLPKGVTIEETSPKINTAILGDHEATVKINFTNSDPLTDIKVPVEVVPLDADNANIGTQLIIEEQGNGENVDLTKGIKGYNLLNVKKAETMIPVTNKEVGKFQGKLKLTFEDNSTLFIYIPVEITEKKIDFNAETQKIQIYKDHVVTNGDLRNAFTNLPANSEVIDLTNPPVDTSTVGEKSAKVKVILKDGRESEHVVLLEVIDPIGELNKQIEADKEKIKTITENNEKLVKEIEKLQNQINELVIKLNQAEADKLDLQNQINTLTTEKTKLELIIKNNDELIKELGEHIKTLKAEVENLKETIKGKDAEIKTLLEKIGNLETKVETLTKENIELKEKLATATEKIANLEKKAEDLENQVKDLTNQVNAKTEEINTLKDTIKDLEKEVATLTESGKAKDAEIERLNKEIEELKSKLAEKTTEIEKLTKEINSLKEKLSVSETKNTDLEKQVANLETKVETLTKENTELKEKLATATEKVSNLEKDNEALNKDLDTEKEKNKDLENKVSELTDKNKDLEDKIADLENQKKDLEDKLEIEKNKDEKDEEKIKDLEEKINEKDKEINNISKDKKSLEDKINELIKEKEKLQKVIDENNKKPNINNNINIDLERNDFAREYRRNYNDLPFEIVYEREVPRYINTTTQVYNRQQEDKLEYIFTIGSTTYQKIMGANIENRNMDVAPYIKNSRTMLPLRYVAEAIGAEVRWDNATRTAYFTKNGITAKIQIDGNKIEISDGRIYTMDSKPDNIKNRIFVSLTNISKVFNLTNGNTEDGTNQQIEWNNINKTVSISLDR